MADPFEVLRTPLEQPAPDGDFAQRLRTRIERALSLPKGVTVSNLDRDTDPDLEAETELPIRSAHAPAVRAVLTPYLAISGAAEAIEWYAAAFGATRRGEPIVMPDGRVGHAEMEISGALIMLADEFSEIGFFAPTEERGASVQLHLTVAEVDDFVERAVADGAELLRAVADFEYGRNGSIRDPFGHRWIISGEPAPERAMLEPSVPRAGDVGYVSLWVDDIDLASSFYSSVLGWRYGAGSGSQGRQIEGLSIHHGMWGGQNRSTLFCCFAVDDIEAAVRTVRSAGGTAEEPQDQPYGRVSGCVDDQGVPFAIYEPQGGTNTTAGERGPRDGRYGEVSYITMEVDDSAKTREFYGQVLGWQFDHGTIDDGWAVRDVQPMIGISGGHSQATTVPLYEVEDIRRAVHAVRASGGTATDPATQPYGVTSECIDDQGTRFLLGQF